MTRDAAGTNYRHLKMQLIIVESGNHALKISLSVVYLNVIDDFKCVCQYPGSKHLK